VAAVVAELAALDVGHVAQEHDTRRTMPGSRFPSLQEKALAFMFFDIASCAGKIF